MHAIRVLPEQEGLHARQADRRRRVRQLSARLRELDSGARQGLGSAARRRAAEGEARGADRAAAQLGFPLGRERRSRIRSRCSDAQAGARRRWTCAAAVRQTRRRRSSCVAALWPPRRTSSQRTSARGRRRGATSIASSATTANIVQPFDDAKPSIPVGFTSATWGSLASFGARDLYGHEEDVRHEREQLRGGRGVRDRIRSARGQLPPAARAGIPRPSISMTRRSDTHREFAAGLLLSRTTCRAYRADLQAWAVAD